MCTSVQRRWFLEGDAAKVRSPMPSRTIQVTDEAYDLLASLKRDRESFTDVVKRLAGERSLFDVVGVLDEEQARRMETRIEQGRERSRKRRAKQLRRG